MAFPQMQPGADAEREYQFTFYDGVSRTVYVSERERPYPKGRLIVSRTDLNGVITHANQAFVEISGYEREELIGQPQCVLRHPDMPHSVYESLWATLQEGKKWHGYLKNLCKDGSHYWVYATVIPNERNGQVVGYASVRREPSRKKIEEWAAIYKERKASEGDGV